MEKDQAHKAANKTLNFIFLYGFILGVKKLQG